MTASCWRESIRFLLLQIDKSFLTQQPEDYVKSQRSNYKQFEILRQLERLNKLVFPIENLSYSYVYENPSYKKNSKAQAEEIMAGLRRNPDFNPSNMEKVFAEYGQILDQAVRDYAEIYALAVERHNREKAAEAVEKAYEIDEYRSSSPSGKQVDIGLFSSYTRYENDGQVYLRNGAYLYYNIVHDPSGHFFCYRVSFSNPEWPSSEKDFQSFNAMVRILSETSLKSR